MGQYQSPSLPACHSYMILATCGTPPTEHNEGNPIAHHHHHHHHQPIDYRNEAVLDALRRLPLTAQQSLVGLGCGEGIAPTLQGFQLGGGLQALQQRLPWTPASKAAKVHRSLSNLCESPYSIRVQIVVVMSSVHNGDEQCT